MAQRKTGSRNGSGGTGGKSGTGCLIWLIMLLVTLLLFVFSWDKIQSTLEATGFIDAVGSSRSARPGPAKPASDPVKTPVAGDGSLEPGAQPASSPTDAKPADTGTEPATKPVAAPAANPRTTTQPGGKPADNPLEPTRTTPMELVKATRVTGLYFIRVDDDGVITRHQVKRTVGASDSPMTDALDALMSGPNADELARGYISLIPSEAKLLSAQVLGSTAYLNFNEPFMYNRYGIEGYAGQLKQIIYTATEFSTVKDVQILIDGQKRDYLGGDGVFIGKPLSRASF